MQLFTRIFIGVVVAVGGFFGANQIISHDNFRAASPIQKQTPTTKEQTVDEQNKDTADVTQNTSNDTTTSEFFATHSYIFDTSAIPLGDGRISSSPKVGYVYSCQQTFSENAGGAQVDGDWIHGKTWSLKEKIFVQGKVYWSTATFNTMIQNTLRALSGNGLPVGSPTGTFPVSQSDPAYQIDRNPNVISAQTVSYKIPANPTRASQASCVPMGAIGVALNGVAIFNALDGRGDDAVAHEVQDLCAGHPERTGEYHYHGPSDCVEGANKNNTLVGYAFDGFGIFSRFDAEGREYTNADLDECHGVTSEVEWDGKKVSMYHYVLTQEYPYTLGCFRGTPVISLNTMPASGGQSGVQQSSGQQTSQQNEPKTGGPPQEAITACSGKAVNTSCSFSGGQGMVNGSCRQTPEGVAACVP